MFGSKKKQAPDPPKRKGASLANQMGIGDIENMMYGYVDNDEDLEAELLALQGEDNPVRRKPKQQQKSLTMADLDKYSKIAEINEDDDDEDVSDTEDPDLLAELEDLSTEEDTEPGTTSPSTGGKEDQVILLVERLSMYEAGVESAKSAGDTSKQKRYDRGLKTIQDLLKKAQQGKTIDESDIPPAITVSAQAKQRPGGVMQSESSPTFKPTTDSGNKQPSPSPPKQPALEMDNTPVSPETSSHDLETEKMLETRRDQYKTAALQAKHTGDINTAKSYVQIAKQFDNVLTALKSGQAIDLSKMPPPPSSPGSTSKAVPPVQTASRTEQSTNQGAGEEDNTPAPSAEESRKVFKAPDPPKTVMEALEQRLEKYKSAEAEAKAAGEGSKARRHGRIVKQYQDSIKASKAGKPLNLEELPCPPGLLCPLSYRVVTSKISPISKFFTTEDCSTTCINYSSKTTGNNTPKSPSSTSQKAKPSFKRSPSSRAEQTSHFLSERMNEYRTAALQAKKNNDIELAKKYIRIAKGFEPMIIAAESGLLLTCLRFLPQWLKIMRHQPYLLAGRTTCATNQQNFTKIGDVVSSAKFEKMEKGCRKDLESLKNAFRHNDPVPKFHYENRTFSLVKCNTDLGENDLELTVVRGLQYNAPSGYSEKDLDTYVKFEFPYPQEDPQVGTSETVKSTTNPEGRKQVGGKLEVKIRIRDPFKRKQVEVTKEKWLVIDQFIRALGPKETKKGMAPAKPAVSKSKSSGTMCLEVLKYEKQLLDNQIASLKSQLTKEQYQTLTHKSQLLQQKTEEQQGKLKSGGKEGLKDYVKSIEAEIPQYEEEARYFAKGGDMHKAQVMLTKKKHVEKELAAIRNKYPDV
ncbi:CC2D1 [Mytilus edulis]|uniref:CC2D1 n=1 Tax=Mytilus edulis TaxID=6550 RepID=A0A8S3RYW0_MYTED|nr:CC2D1 [Mytilus edulis]